MKNGNHAAKTSPPRRITSAVAGQVATDLPWPIVNCDRVNAIPAAAKEHKHFYLLLFRNLIKQHAVMMVFCTAGALSVIGAESGRQDFDPDFSREWPGGNSTWRAELSFVTAPLSCQPCSDLIAAASLAIFPRDNPQPKHWSAPERDGARPSLHHVSTRCADGTPGGTGQTFGTTSNPVVATKMYE